LIKKADSIYKIMQPFMLFMDRALEK